MALGSRRVAFAAALALGLVAAFAYLAPAPSGAFNFMTPKFKWPGKTVTYNADYGAYKQQINEAVTAINHSGIGTHLKDVSKAKADITIEPFNNDEPVNDCVGNDSLLGLTNVKLTTRDFQHFKPNPPAKVHIQRYNDSPPECRFVIEQVVVHELGHALGLDHEPGDCAAMNYSVHIFIDGSPPSSYPDQCGPADAGHQWWCRLLSSDDLTGLKRLYGGNPQVADQVWCPVTDPKRATSSSTAALETGIDDGVRVRVSPR